MTAEIAFRTLTAAAVRRDVDALIAIAADVPGEYWAAENFLAERPEKWQLSFGVWQDDRLIGYAILSRPGPEHIHLHHFMVAAAEHNGGYGKHMVAEMVARCRAAGADTLTLKTPKENTGAIRFYSRFGFVETGLERGHIAMSKSL